MFIQKACLPSMAADIQAVLDEHAPGCKLGIEEHANEDPTDEELRWFNDPQVVELAKKLYPEDFILWHDHCAVAKLEVDFKPGKLGIEVKMASGLVTLVTDGQQADSKGVRVGMIFVSVQGEPYTEEKLKAANAGNDDYHATFAKEHQTTVAALPRNEHDPLYSKMIVDVTKTLQNSSAASDVTCCCGPKSFIPCLLHENRWTITRHICTDFGSDWKDYRERRSGPERAGKYSNF